MKTFLLIAYALVAAAQFSLAESSHTGEPVTLETSTGKIFGTLLVPDHTRPLNIVLLIAGSGPTDRDGNDPAMTNNSLKLLAEKLYNHNIASLRYDKRGVGESKGARKKEIDLRFDDGIDDACGWITMLKSDKRFGHIIVIGHSEGSLIGMLATQRAHADGFISISGAGHSADVLLKTQMQSQPPEVPAMVNPIIDSLKNGSTVTNVNPALSGLFRPSVQPYLISWFKYDPQVEIKKLSVPMMIVQGTHDIQVAVDDAQALAAAAPAAKLALIENMNHVLKEADADRTKNISTYNDPSLPVMQTLIDAVAEFVEKIP